MDDSSTPSSSPDPPQQATGPTWSFSSFLTSISLMDIVANKLNESRPRGMTEAQWAKELTPTKIKQALENALPEMVQKTTQSFQDLQAQEHIDASVMNVEYSKFLADGRAFEYKFVGMDVYHGGLEKLIGQPHLDIEKRMEWEHTESDYALTAFDAPICASPLGKKPLKRARQSTLVHIHLVGR